jgi:hypothetical protein
MRIELTYRAWEASVLPLNYTRNLRFIDLTTVFILSNRKAPTFFSVCDSSERNMNSTTTERGYLPSIMAG